MWVYDLEVGRWDVAGKHYAARLLARHCLMCTFRVKCATTVKLCSGILPVNIRQKV